MTSTQAMPQQHVLLKLDISFKILENQKEIVTILTKFVSRSLSYFIDQKSSFSVSGNVLNQHQHENVLQRRENK